MAETNQAPVNNSNGWKAPALTAMGAILLTMAVSYFSFGYNAVKHEDFSLLRDAVKGVAEEVTDLRKDLIPRDDLNRMRDQIIKLQAEGNTLAQETVAQRRRSTA